MFSAQLSDRQVLVSYLPFPYIHETCLSKVSHPSQSLLVASIIFVLRPSMLHQMGLATISCLRSYPVDTQQNSRYFNKAYGFSILLKSTSVSIQSTIPFLLGYF